MKLVDDWKQSWKWLSIHGAVIVSALNAAQASVPYVQSVISPSQLAWINAGLGIAIIWVRLIDQGS